MLRIERRYEGELPYDWEYEIDAVELVNAVTDDRRWHRRGATRFAIVVHGNAVDVDVTDVRGTHATDGWMALTIAVTTDAQDESQFDATVTLVDDVAAQLADITQEDIFAAGRRRPMRYESSRVFRVLDDVRSETVTFELPEALSFELDSSLGARTAIAAAERALGSGLPSRHRSQPPLELESVELGKRSLTVTSAKRGHAMAAIHQLLLHRAKPPSYRVRIRPTRAQPRASAARYVAATLLTAATLGWWVLPLDEWSLAAPAAASIVAVAGAELYLRRRGCRRAGGKGAVVAAVGLQCFLAAYAIAVLTDDHSITRTGTGASLEQLGEAALVAVGVAATAGPLGFDLKTIGPKVIAHVELLFFFAVVARAALVATRRATGWLRERIDGPRVNEEHVTDVGPARG